MNFKQHKINVTIVIFVITILVISFGVSILFFFKLDMNQYDNTIRILIESQKDKISKGDFDAEGYPFAVYDLEGTLIATSTPDFFQDKNINIQELLQFDKSYAINNKNLLRENFVLQKNGKVTGFITFLVPQKLLTHFTKEKGAVTVFLPLGIGILISIILMSSNIIYVNRWVLQPLREISNSAKGIISGNYNLEVVRTNERKIGNNEVGDLTYSFELMRDELKMKQVIEESLKKSQQELISCISHDLKTPISTIKAYTEGLRDGIAKTEESKAEYVKIILNKTDLLINMISELLEYSNIQLKQLTIFKQEIFVIQFLKPLMEELFQYVYINHILLTYELPENDFLVLLDKTRITEVLYNLIENSMKYMSEKEGRILIQVKYVNKRLLIKIIDNGIGIQPDDIPYIFDKFYRAEKSRSSRIPGSGLGLSICQYIITEHNGEIYCKNNKEGGCEIGFYLPVI